MVFVSLPENACTCEHVANSSEPLWTVGVIHRVYLAYQSLAHRCVQDGAPSHILRCKVPAQSQSPGGSPGSTIPSTFHAPCSKPEDEDRDSSFHNRLGAPSCLWCGRHAARGRHVFIVLVVVERVACESAIITDQPARYTLPCRGDQSCNVSTERRK